ncbi:uncharacterized protein [Ptychodera flava]|uniref:uncharacterized protein n=1 Tax=Ptychodera flava TaxID=63121 RepID=UPI00396A79C0
MVFHERGDRLLMPMYSVRQIFLAILIFSWTVKCMQFHQTRILPNHSGSSATQATAQMMTKNSSHSVIVVTLNTTLTINVSISELMSQDAKARDIIVINEVNDRSLDKYMPLRRPIEIKVTDISLPLVKYPLKYTNKTVNNYAYEDILSKDNDENYIGCNPDVLCDLKASKHQKSQQFTKGFCCYCDDTRKSKYQTRGGQDCSSSVTPDYITDHSAYHASTHCLVLDSLWYKVHEIEQPTVEHSVKLNINVGDNKSSAGLVEIADFMVNDLDIGTRKPIHGTENDKVSVIYSDNNSSMNLSFPINFQDKVILTADVKSLSNVQSDDPQTKHGAFEYLVVNKSDITVDGSQCDKMGVSYQAFVNQDDPCHQPLMTCLENQPYNAWFQDTNKMAQGKKGRYFAGFYGDLMETNFSDDESPSSEDHFLVYEYPYNYSYLIEIIIKTEVNTDGINPYLKMTEPDIVLHNDDAESHDDEDESSLSTENGHIVDGIDSQSDNAKSEKTQLVTIRDDFECTADNCTKEETGKADIADDSEQKYDETSSEQVAENVTQNLHYLVQYFIMVAESMHESSSLTHVYGILATLIFLLLLIAVAIFRSCVSKKPKRLEDVNGHAIKDTEKSQSRLGQSKANNLGGFSDEEVERLPPVVSPSKSKRRKNTKSKGIENSSNEVPQMTPKKSRRASTDSKSSSTSSTPVKSSAGKDSGKQKSITVDEKSKADKVYLNLRGSCKQIKNSGQTFSLCGVISRSGEKGKPYKFELNEKNNQQLYEISKGKRKRLNKPRPLNSDICKRSLTEAEFQSLISVNPRYTCLNAL